MDQEVREKLISFSLSGGYLNVLALCSVKFPNQKGLGCRIKWLECNSALNCLLDKYRTSNWVIGITLKAVF